MLFNEPKLLKSKSAPMKDIGFWVSVLFNEPKLLKYGMPQARVQRGRCFSALQRAEIAEIRDIYHCPPDALDVSVLFNEPKLLKYRGRNTSPSVSAVSVLFNEPKLLKSPARRTRRAGRQVSVLFNEPKLLKCDGAGHAV